MGSTNHKKLMEINLLIYHLHGEAFTHILLNIRGSTG